MDGIEALVGEYVTFFCANYIYAGKVEVVDFYSVTLSGACVVYETGPFTDPVWKDAQKFPSTWRIVKTAIESYGTLKQPR